MNREIVELREVIRKLVPLLTGKGLQVTQRGVDAYVQVDGKTKKPILVNIPSLSDNASPEFIAAIQGFIDHEVAHVLITDFTIELRDADGKLLEGETARQMHSLHNIVEDTMIEKEIVKIFPGSARNIATTRRFFLERVTQKALDRATSAEDEFNYLLVPMMRALAGHAEMQDFMDAGKHWAHPLVDQLMKALSPDFLAKIKVATTTAETLVLAEELHAILYPPAPTQPQPQGQQNAESETQPGEGDETGKGDSNDGDQSDEPQSEGGDGGQGKDAETDQDGETDEGGDDTGKSKAGDADGDAGEDDAAGADGGDAEDGDEAADAGDADDDAPGSGDEPGDQPDARGGDDDAGADEGDADGAGDGDADGVGDEFDEETGGDEGDGNVTLVTDRDKVEQAGAGGGEAGAKGKGDNTVAEGGTEDGTKGSDDDDGAGNGVGTSQSRSVFDVDLEALEKADMSSQLALLITEQALAEIGPKDYLPFTRDHDRIEPVQVPERINSTWVPEMEERVRVMTGRMQKDIERLMASQSHIIRTPGHKIGRLHAPSLYRVPQGDPRVFTQKQEHKSKDTAVTLLCDNSGSMGGRKQELAMIAAYALSVTLDRVKIAHEVLGFTTGNMYKMSSADYDRIRKDFNERGVHYDRSTPIEIPIYKSFEERIDARVKARFAYMMNAQKGLAGNIDGESLLYAAERLAKRMERRKVMLVLSDGMPAGGPKSGSHLAAVVKQLQKSGIECIGIGIMSNAVERYYPKFTVLKNIEQLPNEVMGELKHLLAA